MARAKLFIPLLTTALLLAASPGAPGQGAATAEAEKAPRTTVAAKRSRSTLAPASQAWWLGTAFMILTLGAAGAVCIAAKRQGCSGAAVKMQVVGRVQLPPRHAVYAVKAGARTLLIGTGPQGAPALLGELEDEPPLETPAPPPHRSLATHGRFDVRIGDES